MEDIFPILQFEPNVAHKLLRTMNEIDALTFSFCSKESKSLATSAKIRRLSVSIEITEEVRLRIQFIFSSQYHIHLGNPAQSPWRPGSVGVTAQGSQDRLQWNMPNYTFNDWIAHLTEVLRCSISLIRVVGGRPPAGSQLEAPQEVIEAVGEATKGMDIKEMMISNMLSNKTADMVSSKLTNMRSIQLLDPAFESPMEIRKFSIQNLDTLSIFMRRNLQFSLDDVLATNSRQLFITSEVPLNEKQLNRFLKLWQNGATPRLEVFFLISPEEIFLNENEIVNGIKHQVIPDEEERIFMRPVEGPDGRFEQEIYGGIDIWRKDGTLGTIILNEMPHFFQFYVWHKP
ncbi:unnamed protein product [Caenorhabditis brenneri]